MVRWWDAQIDKGIAITKYRIKHLEFHGDGKSAMEEKSRLLKQERHKKQRDTK